MTRLALTAAEVAAQLALSRSRFYVVRPRLEAAGFPRPLPGLVGNRWSTKAVTDWVAAAAQPATVPGSAPADDDIAAWQAVLDRRFER